jgi:hypothetical protein
VTIIGGQSLCLFLTLLACPVAYVQMDALEQRLIHTPLGESMRKLAAGTIGRLRPARETN